MKGKKIDEEEKRKKKTNHPKPRSYRWWYNRRSPFAISVSNTLSYQTSALRPACADFSPRRSENYLWAFVLNEASGHYLTTRDYFCRGCLPVWNTPRRSASPIRCSISVAALDWTHPRIWSSFFWLTLHYPVTLSRADCDFLSPAKKFRFVDYVNFGIALINWENSAP